VKLGEPTGIANHPRARGITHIAQVVRRPEDDAPFVSESIGSAVPPELRLMPLGDWLALMRTRVTADGLWEVDAFRSAAEVG
jgi:hypothetical protein